MEIIDPNPQTRWRESFASSPQVRATVGANGEKKTYVVPPSGTIVLAGFDSPTVAPTVADTTSGTYGTTDFVCYRYVYASSQYPFVYNIVTGGGELWPRSSPSPASAVHNAGGASKKYVVTVTKTTRSDVDYIWIYRTAIFTTADEATNSAAAGEMFYIGRVANDGVAGTTTFTDDKITDTSELLELDNYPAPTFQFVVFDGTYWWGIGNFSLDAEATMNGTANIVLSDDEITQWFDGRNGQTATFEGITSGGYDGRGNFYWKYTGPNDATMYSNEAMTSTVAVPATGTTRIHLRGPGATLYRSKQLNPFSWGRTFENFNTDDSVSREPALWAEPLGAGFASGIAILGNDSYLIVHLEEPTRTLRFTLSEAANENFIATQKNIDTQASIGSHFTQFQARTPDGHTFLCGIDTKNFAVMVCDGEQLVAISSPIFQTMRSIMEDDTVSRFFHGIYDARTELNVWYFKALDLGTGNLIDTMAYQHAPTGLWGTAPAFGVSASATIYDPQTKETFTMIGTEDGRIARAFDA